MEATIAHLAGEITEPTFHSYILFALNYTYTMMKDGFLQKTRRRSYLPLSWQLIAMIKNEVTFWLIVTRQLRDKG